MVTGDGRSKRSTKAVIDVSLILKVNRHRNVKQHPQTRGLDYSGDTTCTYRIRAARSHRSEARVCYHELAVSKILPNYEY